jgi:DUF438 domain-containing protein
MNPLYLRLPAEHMVRVLVEEHEVLLGALRRLAALCDAIGREVDEKLDKVFTDELSELADTLLAAEPHHQREEDVLFPELEQLGIEGPPAVMRAEHVRLREDKATLRSLADRAASEPLAAWREQLMAVAPQLVAELSAHIEKENEILYPMALSELDPALWSALGEAAQKIGPCSFPRAA